MEQSTSDKFKNFLNTWPQHKNNPKWLADASVEIASLMFYAGEEMAKAEMKEVAATVNLIDGSALTGDKKMSATEAEKRALVETANLYGLLKANHEDMREVLNAVKKQIEVLGWELKQGGNQP